MYPVASLDGVQDTLILVGPSWTAITLVGGEAPDDSIRECFTLLIPNQAKKHAYIHDTIMPVEQSTLYILCSLYWM